MADYAPVDGNRFVVSLHARDPPGAFVAFSDFISLFCQRRCNNFRNYAPVDDNSALSTLESQNIVAVVLHFMNFTGMVIGAFSSPTFWNFSVPLTYSTLSFDKESRELQSDVHLMACVLLWPFCAAFFLLSAVFQLVPACQGFYKAGTGTNPVNLGPNAYRWIEYALSSSIMICVIAALAGIRDVCTLLCIFLLNACMNLFGLVMEDMNRKHMTGQGYIKPFLFGCIAAIGPWTCIIGTLAATSGEMPFFVNFIFWSYLGMFMLFPINMFIEYSSKGDTAARVSAERGYIVLSVVAKTILGWAVFFGLKQPPSTCV